MLRRIRLSLALLGGAWILIGFCILFTLDGEADYAKRRFSQNAVFHMSNTTKHLIENPDVMRNLWIFYGIGSIFFLPFMATAPQEKIIQMLKEGSAVC